jgi:hypothetical protein
MPPFPPSFAAHTRGRVTIEYLLRNPIGLPGHGVGGVHPMDLPELALVASEKTLEMMEKNGWNVEPNREIRIRMRYPMDGNVYVPPQLSADPSESITLHNTSFETDLKGVCGRIVGQATHEVTHLVNRWTGVRGDDPRWAGINEMTAIEVEQRVASAISSDYKAYLEMAWLWIIRADVCLTSNDNRGKNSTFLKFLIDVECGGDLSVLGEVWALKGKVGPNLAIGRVLQGRGRAAVFDGLDFFGRYVEHCYAMKPWPEIASRFGCRSLTRCFDLAASPDLLNKGHSGWHELSDGSIDWFRLRLPRWAKDVEVQVVSARSLARYPKHRFDGLSAVLIPVDDSETQVDRAISLHRRDDKYGEPGLHGLVSMPSGAAHCVLAVYRDLDFTTDIGRPRETLSRYYCRAGLKK